MGAAERIISGVDFISIPTHDLESAVEFYGSTLGLRMSVHRPDRHFAEFETGNLTLSVFDFEKAGLPHQQSQNPVALHVDDVQGARGACPGAASPSSETRSTPACATWRSSRTRTRTP